MADKNAERILVVPTAVFHRVGYFQGFCDQVGSYVRELLYGGHASYRLRGQMEEDPSFKQIIPYVIFRCGTQVFRYTRGKLQGEKRLHALRSIGVGGHISAEDRNLFDSTYEEAMQRELAEEVRVESPYRQRIVGMINDDETPVGRVHLGIVHLCDLEEPKVRPRERALTRAGFEEVGRLLERIDQFETWSQICLRALFGGKR